MIEYPYMMANNKISQIIISLQSAAKPPKFTSEFLKNLGYTSSNDRGILSIFKKLGFLTDDGVPTSFYDQLRDKSTSKVILANRIRDLYSELFVINTNIYKDTDDNIKGAISRVTGKDETGVTRIFNTFKALCVLADFDHSKTSPISENPTIKTEPQTQEIANPTVLASPDFHYNIQIHLPATTDISVYNAIFKSLKENLGI